MIVQDPLLDSITEPGTSQHGGFQEQVIGEDGTVVKRLDEAGAVLVAKLSLAQLPRFLESILI